MGGGEAVSGRVIAGIGCRANCPADAILAIVSAAISRTGRSVSVLAVPAFKAQEPGLLGAALRLGLPLVAVDADALAAAQRRCATQSERAAQATGFASIAEGSALAAAGPNGRLILRRISGGAATCALAEAIPP